MDIQKLTTALKTSTSVFAEEIGVSRPIISHIQNGRNKPSLAVIQKISERYPQVSLDWLVHGKGEILVENNTILNASKEDHTSSPTLEDTMVSASESPKKSIKSLFEENLESHNPSEQQEHKRKATDPIIRIVHYYASGTFEEFHPKTPGTQEG